MEGAGALTGALAPPEDSRVSHYVHENARTYWKFGRVVMNGIGLIIKGFIEKRRMRRRKKGIKN